MKKILPVAVLAAMAGVNGAQAVHVNSDGLGQVLLYPYYTTTEGQDTLIHLVNTTNDYKAVKVRILESMNSREVLDFNLYLSPQDHWDAVIYADPDGEGAVIRSDDKSCTVPLPISLGQVIPFRTFEFPNDSVNSLERTKEGYVEVIEMGTIVPGTQNWPADILHIDGLPGGDTQENDGAGDGEADGCPDLDTSWAQGGIWNGNPNDGLSVPTGGLYGYGVLIDVAEGTSSGYDAVALDNFWDFFGSHTNPGSLLPGLGDSTPFYDVITGNQVINGLADNGLDAVSAVLMHDTLSNDYVMEKDVDAGTDWVVTMPTKRDYVNVPANDPAIAPFMDVWEATDSRACEEFTLDYYDREEGAPDTPITGNDFSPQPPGEDPNRLLLCAEANVVSFAGELEDGTAIGTQVLEASARNGRTVTLADGFENGWAVMDFTSLLNDDQGDPVIRPSLDGGIDLNTGNDIFFDGLPVIGFAVQKYVNSVLEVNGETVLSNYAGSVLHKGARSTYQITP